MVKNKIGYIAIICILSILIVALFSSGCSQQTITCNKPYILVGNECCLDQNNNTICDKDETSIQPEIYYSAKDIENARAVCSIYCSASNFQQFCTREINIGIIDKNGQLTGNTISLKCQDDILNAGIIECQEARMNKASCT